MAAFSCLVNFLLTYPFFTIVFALCSFAISTIVYRVYYHPLSRVPGPFLAKCTFLYLYYHTYIGDEASHIDGLHQTYGPVVRIGPYEVDIADGAALAPIYSEKGGFAKSACYSNFDVDGHATIFSALTLAHRAPRAKAVSPLFSTNSIRANSAVIAGCVDTLVARMRNEAKMGKPVDLLNLTRSLALDAISSYLFQLGYQGMDEQGAHLSASPFVDAFVAVGRVFYLPNRAFAALERINGLLWRDPKVKRSVELISRFVSRLIDGATDGDVKGSKGSGNYPSRMLEGGIEESEVHSQCKDLIFAGTDSTGMNLAMICWFLVKYPESYHQLRDEVLANAALPQPVDIQTLPYLRCVVREGLRLSMGNPTRFPRVVPAGGFVYDSYTFPAGTNVGMSPYTLHKNGAVFENPNVFKPERWLDPSPEMMRDWIPFGQGTRACIARNLAMTELFMTTEALVRHDVLKGAKCVKEKIQILEWFNSKVIGEKVELIWDKETVET